MTDAHREVKDFIAFSKIKLVELGVRNPAHHLMAWNKYFYDGTSFKTFEAVPTPFKQSFATDETESLIDLLVEFLSCVENALNEEDLPAEASVPERRSVIVDA